MCTLVCPAVLRQVNLEFVFIRAAVMGRHSMLLMKKASVVASGQSNSLSCSEGRLELVCRCMLRQVLDSSGQEECVQLQLSSSHVENAFYWIKDGR